MTTHTIENTHTHYKRIEPTAHLGHIGRGLLALFIVIVALLSAVPIILLFFVTSVPAFIAAGLVFIDLGIVAALL